MSRIEPFVFIVFPEEKKTSVDFRYSLLPKWVQLYIMRWWERKKHELGTAKGICKEIDVHYGTSEKMKGGENVCQKQRN